MSVATEDIDRRMSRTSAAKVARWLVGKDRRDDAVAVLSAWAVTGPSDKEGQDLLAEALRLAPGAAIAKLAFERMEGVSSSDQAPLDAAIRRWTSEELAGLEKHIPRQSFLKAQVGFNNNVKYKGSIFHIQTEDSGLDKPHIITHLFADGGRIIKSHKRAYAGEVGRQDVALFVRALMKGQHMEMAILLREGRFDEVIAGRAVGGIQVLEEPPRLEVQKLATKREERVEAVAPPRDVSASRVSDDDDDDTIVRPRGDRPKPPPLPVSAHDLTPPAPPPLPAQPSVRGGVSRFRLHVVRSLHGGPAVYEPAGDVVTLGASGDVALRGDRFCEGKQALLKWQDGRVWLVDQGVNNGVFLRIRQPALLEFGDEFMVGDQVLFIDRNPEPDDGPGPGPTYFYASPKWASSFRVVQRFERGGLGACVVARGSTMQIGAAIGDFVFTNDPLVDDQHCLVEEQAGVIVLSDLGSRSGVFVRIKGEQEVVAGDVLILGRTRFLIELC
jgi:hypothetical protein